MKKFIAILMSAVMLIGVMSLSSFAVEYDAGLPATVAPEIDGIVEDGEYGWTSGKYDTKVAEDGVFNLLNDPAEPDFVEFFMAHDEDFIYIAYREQKVSPDTKIWLDLNPRAMLPDSQGQILCQVKLIDGVASSSALECISSSERSDKKDTYLYDVSGSSKDGVNTIEIQFDREALEDYAGEEFDALGFRAILQNMGTGSSEAFGYADANSAARPFWFVPGLGYHILTMQPAPETEAPTEALTEAPETDAPVTEAHATDAPVPAEGRLQIVRSCDWCCACCNFGNLCSIRF